MPEETPQPTTDAIAPAFDTDALATQVAEKLKEQFKQSAPAPQPQPRPAPREQAPDPMMDLLRPTLEPVMRAASIAEESATDAVEFYASHPDLEKTERGEIEKRFKALKAAGAPFKREDIYNHYLGENLDAVVEKRIAKRDEAVKRAANATTVGGGSPDKNPNVQDARGMTTDALGKALDGLSF